jgi:hypothetical protein
MIMSGVVEITTKLVRSKSKDMAEKAMGLLGEMEDMSFSVDMDESFTLDCSSMIPMGAGVDIRDGKLHIDRNKAQARGAVLCCAVLCCAVLCCAVLCCAVLCCVGGIAVLMRFGHPWVVLAARH